MATTEIRCPKCNSNQLTANKRGFSGKKAVIGGLLTGGIGLLAGTIGSNTVKITCLACGHEFKPGQGKNALIENHTTSYYQGWLKPFNLKTTGETNRIDCSDCHTENFTNHKYCKNCGKELNDQDKKIFSTKEVLLIACSTCKNLTPKDGKYCPHCKSQTVLPKSGCFIATACYGDYDAPEVVILRQFRDTHLLTTPFGKLFVSIYYVTSPYIASIIAKSDRLRNIVRQYFLHPFVTLLNRKM